MFVVEGSGENAVASARSVVQGLSGAAEVQILSGLDLQDRVIVEGNSFLEDGQPVWVFEEQ